MSGNDSERETRIRDYLDGRLTGDELEAFELALFHDAALLDDVEATRVLQRGLRAVAVPPVIGALAPPPVISEVVRPPVSPVRRALPLVAASLLAGAALPGYLLWQRAQQDGPLQHLAVETMRGPASPAAPTYTLDARASRVVLEFGVLANANTADYSIELRRGDTLVKRESSLPLYRDEIVHIDVLANQLDAGDYSAKIIERSKQGDERVYDTVRFTLRR